MKQTKIVASVSDRRCDVDFIRQLYNAGVNVIRMNTAHASEDGIKNIIRNVREVSHHIGILIDTKGPELSPTDMAQTVTYDFHVMQPLLAILPSLVAEWLVPVEHKAVCQFVPQVWKSPPRDYLNFIQVLLI